MEETRAHLGYPTADHVLGRMLRLGKPEKWLLVAPYIGPEMGRYLAERGVNYVDAAGNLRLVCGKDYMGQIEGRKPVPRGAGDRGLRAPGYLVIFCILAKPDVVGETVRTLGARAGVAPGTVAQVLARLKHEGVVATARGKRRVVDRDRLMDRWLTAYPDVVRPHLLVGRFRTADAAPDKLEAHVERVLDGLPWGFGGGAAANRITNHYRGEDTVLHVADPPGDLPRRLAAPRSEEGPLTILRAPGTLMLEGAVAHTAHPLLVYTELMTKGNERAREAGTEIRTRFLEA